MHERFHANRKVPCERAAAAEQPHVAALLSYVTLSWLCKQFVERRAGARGAVSPRENHARRRRFGWIDRHHRLGGGGGPARWPMGGWSRLGDGSRRRGAGPIPGRGAARSTSTSGAPSESHSCCTCNGRRGQSKVSPHGPTITVTAAAFTPQSGSMGLYQLSRADAGSSFPSAHTQPETPAPSPRHRTGRGGGWLAGG